MARKGKKRESSIRTALKELKDETIQGVLTILSFIVGLFLALSAFDVAGPVGSATFNLLSQLLGVGYLFLPLSFFLLSIAFLKPSEERRVGITQFAGAILFFVSSIGLVDLLVAEGGLLGGVIAKPLVRLFDVYLSALLLIAILLIGILVLLNAKLPAPSWASVKIFFMKKPKEAVAEPTVSGEVYMPNSSENLERKYSSEAQEGGRSRVDELALESSDAAGLFRFRASGTYTPPPLSLLEKDRGKPAVGDLKASANIIKRTLQNFGIDVEVDEISVGPTVTRYALKPAEGVRLSKIVALQNNLELALAAHPVRVEAPIPGRSLVGIEVPNMSKAIIGLAPLLSQEQFQTSEKALLVALGKDISGHAHFADLARMPHLLIAGATGSGKSVTIHTIITSLLYRNSPDRLRFMMIDPKRVELTLYNGIPHLLTPVITDPKKTIQALRWATKEMARRYDILETEKVRDIDSYHRTIVAPALEKKKEGSDTPEMLPYLVIIVDELADIMQTFPREFEASVVRLAQMSRAVGIHLILSTQRPSVNVITGLIKANVPVRVALQVSSQVDSRTILDTGGAEKLLGAGDMLYLSGELSKPLRLQAPFISEKEVKEVSSFLGKHNQAPVDSLELSGGPNASSGVFEGNIDPDEDVDDTLYEEARELVVGTGRASTSYLQRKLRLGYARAARIMDMLEERGVIGPQDGSKPREVLGERPTE